MVEEMLLIRSQISKPVSWKRKTAAIPLPEGKALRDNPHRDFRPPRCCILYYTILLFATCGAHGNNYLARETVSMSQRMEKRDWKEDPIYWFSCSVQGGDGAKDWKQVRVSHDEESDCSNPDLTPGISIR